MANKFGLSSFLPKSKTLNSLFEWIGHLDPALRNDESDDEKQNEEKHNIENQENKKDKKNKKKKNKKKKNKKKRNKNEDMEDIELAESDEMIYDQDYDDQELPSSENIVQYGKGIVIKKFKNAYRPGNKNYFKDCRYDEEGIQKPRNGLGVVIPFFNEPSHELQQTLHSLDRTWEQLRKAAPNKWVDNTMKLCLIQDGWSRADPSMKEYLKAMFPKQMEDGTYWWDYFEEFQDGYNDNHSNITFVFERKGDSKSIINPQKNLQEKIGIKEIDTTLIVKIGNRRKHNSHEWFLGENGFGDASNTEYYFFTDAFTLYSDTMLYHLVTSLDNNKTLAGVTGRQRLMTREQQGSNESVFSLGYILRMVQLYDFESANAVYNGAFSLGGLLPVLPGPCGLYRASIVSDNKVRNYYFDLVNQDPDKTGMVLGNLKIAEDRVLSYAPVFKSGSGKKIGFNPLAVFYFEAETDLEKLMLQRRRWINGSVCGYIYLLFYSFNEFITWKTNIFRKLYVWILLMCQFLTYCMVSVAPGVSIKILYYGVNYLFGYYGVSLDLELFMFFFILWAIYIAHVFVHNRQKFFYPIMYILLIMSFATSIIGFGSLAHYAFVDEGLTFLQIIESLNYTFYLGAITLIGPFFLALILSGKGHSPLLMIKAIIPYLLFIQMLIAWFGSYSYARTWDLSWGNRPAGGTDDASDEKQKIMVTKFKEQSIRIVIALIVLNIGIFFVPIEGQFYIMDFFYAIVVYQMFFSLIYCVLKLWYKIKFSFIKLRLFLIKVQNFIKPKKKNQENQENNEQEMTPEITNEV